jgi:hypothetical protein
VQRPAAQIRSGDLRKLLVAAERVPSPGACSEGPFAALVSLTTSICRPEVISCSDKCDRAPGAPVVVGFVGVVAGANPNLIIVLIPTGGRPGRGAPRALARVPP